MSETNQVHNITNLPPAPKQRKLRNPFAKSEDATSVDAEQTVPKHRLNRATRVGILLVAGGVVAAAVSRLARKSDDEDQDTSTDDTEVA